MKMTVTNTAGILFLVENAKGRNRSVYEDKFAQSIDPKGMHVMGLSFPHNDVEMRTQWLCKMRDTDEPTEIWLDVDFDALKECTTDIETNNEEVKSGK
jgi:hypothetical protein